MDSWLWLIPALPLAGFLVLALVRTMPHRAAGVIGAGTVGASGAVAAAIAWRLVACPPPEGVYAQTLWHWLGTAGFDATIGLHLDALSAVFVLVVTAVGFAILLYSVRFMAASEGFGRFFAYMDLFVASMLVLVLADNLLLLYLGWEGVGLCSYLLIGFWYADPTNGRAARKAFLVTRVGDAALVIGLLILWRHLGTLQITELLTKAPHVWAAGSGLATAAALLLLAGAVGKSAQLPLQTWLPDAMAGPTPVSALIHAATMVTAGVYLIARTGALFALAPVAQAAVMAVGLGTLLLAGFSAMTQRDIKRILAYSTMSQIGFMFLAMGVGGWTAAIYHFVTHALFKSALFLGVGVILLHLNDEHDIFRMGGLRKRFPATFLAMLMATLVLAAMPPLTLTFSSKDAILRQVLLSPRGGVGLWLAAMLGVLLTSAYSFRLLFVVFLGPQRTRFDVAHHRVPSGRVSWLMRLPLAVLALAGGLAGIAELLRVLFGVEGFYAFLRQTLPEAPIVSTLRENLQQQAISVGVSLAGAVAAYWLYVRRPALAGRMVQAPAAAAVHRFWQAGWGFDWLYERLFVRPYDWIAKTNARDVVDWLVESPARLAMGLYRLLRRTQTGRLRWYAMGVATGAIVLIALMVWL